jgi:nucleoside-diphosphate-sugar epimerase
VKVLVVGATGAVGRPLVRKLVAADHRVVATARHRPTDLLAGAEFRSLDLLEPGAVESIVREVRPVAIIHQATTLTGIGNNVRAFDRSFATTNRLRVEGTRALIEAGHTLASPPRLVVQSFCGWPWAPDGGPVKSEEDDLDPRPAPAFRRTLAALKELEDMVTGYANGVVLRYAALYGPGTSLTTGGAQIEAIRTRAFPLVGDATATWSFLHVEDAADAAVAALTRGRGIYNITDDHPVRIGEWLTDVARLIDAAPPRRVPVWLARIVGGEGLVHMMTRARGSSNSKAHRDLGWTPGHADWREGFAAELGPRAATS